jgi:hypothetical protein
MIALARPRPQGMPEPLRRWPMATVQPDSAPPVEGHNPSASNSGERMRRGCARRSPGIGASHRKGLRAP